MTTATETKQDKRVNGVSVMGLHDTIKAVRQTPALGKAVFRAKNQWLGQALNRTTIGNFFAAGEERTHKQQFVFDNDEGEVLLGKDEGANPVEFILHALAGCVTTTTVYHAAARGIKIRSIETTLEGELDLQGLLQTNPSVAPGYQNIQVNMKIDSDATPEQLQILKTFHAFSPVVDTLRRPVNLNINIQTKNGGEKS